jgi:Response regulator containing CheY-like receiver domain and AraC-type DNA-binding domain
VYRIAIVDDERIVKLAVQSMIDWSQSSEGAPTFELAGTASDGAEALELVERERVDIVISDLRMAGMDGLEMLGRLMRLEAPPEVIVLSNFGDYEYVREALKGGALDYILKTDIGPERLMAAIREAAARLDERGRALVSERAFIVEAEGSLEALRSAYRRASSRAREQGQGALLGSVLALALDPESDRPVDGALRALLPQGLKFCDSCVLAPSEGGSLFVMPLFPRDSTCDSGAVASWLSDQLRLYYGIRAGIAWSSPFSCDDELVDAFALAARAADLFFYASNSGVVLDARRYGPPSSGLLDEIESCLRALAASDAPRELRSLLSRAAELGLPPPFVKASVAEAVVRLSGAAAAGRAVEEAASEDRLLEAALSALASAESALREPQSQRAEVVRVLERLDADIARRVCVPDLAAEAGLSESYLCTVFKAQTGKSIVGYVNDRRLERARELLGTGRFLVKEAAAKVGFDDPFYFNRLFKRRFGVAPSSLIPPAGARSPGRFLDCAAQSRPGG